MDRKVGERAEVRFSTYVEGLGSELGHADRIGPLRDYCTGLILPGERKSVEPMAAKTAPARTSAQHQSLLHFVGVAAWSDEKVLAKVRQMVLPSMQRQGPIEAWIIDDTGFPKHGKHSVGVQVQYCGQLGKEANCQVAVSLSIANHSASLPVAYRLYLPKEWDTDKVRRKKAGVPKDIRFKTKPEIALNQIRWACEAGLPRGVALMDAAYGVDSRLRTGMTALGVSYVVGIQPKLLMWPPGTEPKRKGRPLNNTGRRDEPDLISAKRITRDLPNDPVAGGFGRVVVVALCPRARSGRTYPAQTGIDIGGMVADRVACRRSRADQILAVDAAGRHRLPRTRRLRQAALAYRTRLS
jgi:SRSO17 transposase